MKSLTWYVLSVSPLCEKAVAKRLTRHLTGVEHETYLPIIHDKVRRRHRKVDIARLLLPRYLFLGFYGERAEPNWLFVLSVQGVRGVLGVDGKPFAIDEGEVGALMFRCENGEFAPTKPPKVQRGMRVVAVNGTLRGFEGDVVDVSKRDQHAEVLFEMFKGSTPVRIHLDDLVSVSYSSERMIG